MKNTKKNTSEVDVVDGGRAVVSQADGTCMGEVCAHCDGAGIENRLWQAFIARLAATDTYHTSERADTRFRRSYDEAVIAVEIFNQKKGGLK